jgi:hypothetical protein
MIGAVTLVAVYTGVNRLIALAIPQRRPLKADRGIPDLP